jgi:hypothetical protein
MANDTYVRGKSNEQLLADLQGTAAPNSPVWEQQRTLSPLQLVARARMALATVGTTNGPRCVEMLD